MNFFGYVLIIVALFAGSMFVFAHASANLIAKRLRRNDWMVQTKSRWRGVELIGHAPNGRMLHIVCKWWKT